MGRRSLSRAVEIEVLECRRLLSVMGVDAASTYQYILNWNTVKADGYTFGWEKATQGTYYTDSYYAPQVAAAKAAGVPIGAYCFADFGDDPTQTATVFWNEIKSTISGDDGLTLQPMLDCESYETGNEDSWVATWSSVIVADGKADGLNLTPIIYTDTSFADDYFTTATSTNFPLWIASSNPTSSAIKPWTSYEIWQYGEADFPATNLTGGSEGSVATDVDEINPSDAATELQNLVIGTGQFAPGTTVKTTAAVKALQNYNGTGSSSNVASSVSGTVLATPAYYNNAWYFDVSFTTGVSGWVAETSLAAVSGGATIPVNESPATNTSAYSDPTLTWYHDPAATSYNVYINNSKVASGLTTDSYTPNLTAGTYSWYVQAVASGGATTNGTAWSFTLAAPSAPTNSSPANNLMVLTTPTLIWNAATGATSYNVFLNNSEIASALTTTSYTPGTLSSGTYSWYVQAKDSVGSTNGTAWSFTIGQYTPTATFFSQAPTLGASVFDFSISYSNPNYSAAKVDTTTFGNNNITVTGPNGYSQNASFVSQSQPGDGNQRSATYEIDAPNGAWNVLANGTYTITLNNNQVADEGGGYAVGGSLGTFGVNEPFAYIASGSTQLTIDSTSANPSISMSKSGSVWTVSNGGSSYQFNSSAFSSVDFVGTSGNDTLSINSVLNPVPLSFNGGSGSDTLNLYAGSLTFASDVSATTAALTIDMYDSATVNFTSNQHLAGLNLSNDSAALLAAGDAIAVETGALSISNDAYVDVADDALIVNAISASAVNSYLAGDAIYSSTAVSAGYAVGFAPGSAVSYSSINGVSFSTTAIVMRETVDGDANLDGVINSDDLSLMALAVAQEQSAKQNNQPAPAEYWYNGDYNYDTTVNADDYLLLSLGSAVQNQQTLG